MLVYKQLTILKSTFSETRLQRSVNIFVGVGGQLFFLFIYLSFFFLRFHFPDLTFLKLFLSSFCLVLQTLSLQLSSSLSYFVSKRRDARNFNKFRTS